MPSAATWQVTRPPSVSINRWKACVIYPHTLRGSHKNYHGCYGKRLLKDKMATRSALSLTNLCKNSSFTVELIIECLKGGQAKNITQISEHINMSNSRTREYLHMMSDNKIVLLMDKSALRNANVTPNSYKLTSDRRLIKIFTDEVAKNEIGMFKKKISTYPLPGRDELIWSMFIIK